MTCPICSLPSVTAYRPFCSRRCADLDLGKWLTGAYAIPASDEEGQESLPEGPDTAEQKPH